MPTVMPTVIPSKAPPVIPPNTVVRSAYGMARYGIVLSVCVVSTDYWEARVLWKDSAEKGPCDVSGNCLGTDVPIIEALACIALSPNE